MKSMSRDASINDQDAMSYQPGGNEFQLCGQHEFIWDSRVTVCLESFLCYQSLLWSPMARIHPVLKILHVFDLK